MSLSEGRNLADNGGGGRRRLVIFAGPHKAASSSIQEFLVQYASGRRKFRNLQAFHDWRWPRINSPLTKSIPERKIFSRLVLNQTKKSNDSTDKLTQIRNDIWSGIVDTWNNPQRIMIRSLEPASGNNAVNFNNVATSTNNTNNKFIPTMRLVNVVISSEEFDRFGSTPWSGRDGIEAMRQVVKLLQTASSPPPQVDVVVNYRTPRHKHWLSIWKQLTAIESRKVNKAISEASAGTAEAASDPSSTAEEIREKRAGYRNFICHDERVWEYLDCVSNPLGLVQALRKNQKNQFNATLIDMGGVEHQSMDIAHASACHVLNVPCTPDGWVRGINHTLVVNTKTRSIELTDREFEEMEWLFRKRDCAYAQELQNDPGVTILFPHTLWKDCNKEESDIHHQLLNTTFLMQLLQSQYQCHPDTSTTLNLTQWIHSVSTSTKSSPFSQLQDSINSPNNVVEDATRPFVHETTENDVDMTLLMVSQGLQVTAAVLLFVFFRCRRSRYSNR